MRAVVFSGTTEGRVFARQLAQEQGCYKLMLMTGSKRQSTLRFYERAGYRSDVKTAFLQWL